jgi:hypothetical protein
MSKDIVQVGPLQRGRIIEALLAQEQVDTERVKLGEKGHEFLEAATNAERVECRRSSRALAPLIPWSL